MKTYVINLEKSLKRRDHIQAQVEKHGLDYEWIKAVNGLELSDAELENLCDMAKVRSLPDHLNRGVIGCALSHYAAYRKMLRDNVDIAFVLEDDAVLSGGINEVLNAIERAAHKNEIVLLHYMSFTPCKLSRQNAVSLTREHQLMYPLELDQVTSGAAYVITKEAAQALVEFIPPVRAAADEWHYFYQNRKIESLRFVFPPAVSVSGAKSTIQFTAQSGARAKTTQFIDNYKIPVFYQMLRAMRKRSIGSRSLIELVDAPSPLQPQKQARQTETGK